MTTMKNVLVIDAAENRSYGVFQATGDEFKEIFPENGQHIEYAEDLAPRLGDKTTGVVSMDLGPAD